jgi:replication factor A1
MTEKEKLIDSLAQKSGKTKEELNEMISEKVNELSGLISEEGAVYIIANELGVRLESERPKKDANLVKIDEITQPKVPVSLNCKVLRKYDRVNFSSKNGGEGSVQSLLVGDETGIIRLAFWNDKTQLLDNIHEGDILKVINVYSRENTNQERIEIHYSQYSDIEVNPKGLEIKVKEMNIADLGTPKKISELEEGDKNIKLEGIVTDFEIPRYYIGCPECFKKVIKDENSYQCAEHGEVESIKIPIVNVILDDGDATISVVGFRDRAEKMTQLSDKDIIQLTEDIDKYRDFSKKIIGSKLEIIGNSSLNNMTGDIQVIANQILNIEFKNIEEVAKEMIKEDNTSKKTENKKKDNVSKQEDLDDIEEIDIDDDLL